ncbi:MAG: type II secretion system protein GspF [Deltaproteobacteria bacterium]|nr:type II secretion system F family protein [Deltaproteobacteria bacterium]RLA88376.1 MAG: type II secretion system protein GspF [Deltaproteobacteria bacterium]
MAEFFYKASDKMGNIVQGNLDGKDEESVVNKLHTMGYIPIKVQPSTKGKVSVPAPTLKYKKIKGSVNDLLTFTQELSTLLEAGLPLDKSLYILAELAEKRKLSQVINDILKMVREGSTLSDALSKYPGVFPRLYVNMVKAGEAGGVLEEILKRLVEYLESSKEFKEYIISAMIYPAILTSVGTGAVIILLLFVIPKFAQIFNDMGQALPLSTAVFLKISLLFRKFWWMALIGFSIIYLIIKSYLKTEHGKFVKDKILLKIGILGNLIKKIEVARFARTLGTMIKGGVPILSALTIVKDTINNTLIAKSMDQVTLGLREGEGIAAPLRAVNIFPPLALHMITVGEETGQLDEMLLNVANTYDKEVRNIIKRMITLLEPALILFVALLVGFIMISLLTAIFSMNELPF